MSERSWTEKVDDKSGQLFSASIGGIAGMYAGEALDQPITEIARRIKSSKDSKLHNDDVVPFKRHSNNSEALRKMRVKKMNNAKLKPVFGKPKSTSALMGGVVGTAVATALHSVRKEKKDKIPQVVHELSKEASDNYRDIHL